MFRYTDNFQAQDIRIYRVSSPFSVWVIAVLAAWCSIGRFCFGFLGTQFEQTCCEQPTSGLASGLNSELAACNFLGGAQT